jgi:hypothetical protein
MLASIVIAQAIEDQILFEHSRECSNNKTFDNYYRQSQKTSAKITQKLAMVIVDKLLD